MPKRYTSSVKVFFPKLSREEVTEELGRCAAGLREELGLERVILFGSYARGTYTVASDIDIMIVFDGEKSREDEVHRRMMKEIRLPRVELHLVSKGDLKAYRASKWMRVMEEEGVKIL